MGIVVLGICLLHLGARADQSISLAWDGSQDASVAGYFIYCGTASGSYESRIDIGTNTTASVPALKEGLTYYLVVTAYDLEGVESAPSNEAIFIVPGALVLEPGPAPADPPLLQFPVAPGHWYELQATVDFSSWTNIWQTTIATSNAWVSFTDPQASAFKKRFYRLLLH